MAAHKWESVLVLSGHERSVYSVSWGKGKGRATAGEEYVGWLGSVGGDGVIRVWEVVEREGKIVGEEIVSERASHGVQDTNAVSFCGREGFEGVLATAGDDGWIRVWEMS